MRVRQGPNSYLLRTRTKLFSSSNQQMQLAATASIHAPRYRGRHRMPRHTQSLCVDIHESFSTASVIEVVRGGRMIVLRAARYPVAGRRARSWSLSRAHGPLGQAPYAIAMKDGRRPILRWVDYDRHHVARLR